MPHPPIIDEHRIQRIGEREFGHILFAINRDTGRSGFHIVALDQEYTDPIDTDEEYQAAFFTGNRN